jgi:SAM-dependent methyltransferase
MMQYESNAYTGFAFVYDLFMDNIPYDMWCDYLCGLLKKYGVSDGLVAELGCGTGAVTRRLLEKGYDMIGIDSSEDMLAIAREKQQRMALETEGKDSVLYLQQDMREFELYGTVGAFVSVCDSMNYLLKEEDMLRVFRLVNNYLDPGGVFVFDLKTEYYFEQLSEDTIAENRAEASFLWNNFYDRETGVNQYDLTVYVREELLLEKEEKEKEEQFLEEKEKEELFLEEERQKEEERFLEGKGKQKVGQFLQELEDSREEEFFQEPAVFLRFDETHYQRAYSLEKMKELVQKSGMELLAVYDAFTQEPPHEKSERVYFVVREGHQENKLYL